MNNIPAIKPGTVAVNRLLCDARGTTVRLLEAGEEGEWDRFVLASPFGTLFHLSAWSRVVEEVFGRRIYALVAVRDGRITGVFPIAHVRNLLFGDCLISMPLAVYGGICANDWESSSILLNEGASLARRLGVRYLEMRNRIEPFPTALPGRDLYVTFTQDLSPGAEKLFQGLPRDTRYAIRKSQKAGLEWSDQVSEDEFYDIYARSLHHLGTPVFPRKLFKAFREAFAGRVKIFGVRTPRKTIAAVMCFYFRDAVLPYYGGSLRGHETCSPNNFMYWNLISESSKQGVRTFDFGRSKRGTGSYRFKAAWSMVETELPYRYELIKAAEVPYLSPVDKTFELPIAIWQRLPFGWTKALGPQVIRWIPSV